MNDFVKIGDRVTAYDAAIDYYARGEPRVGSRARHGTIIETDEARIRVAWDGGRNRRWLRRNTEGTSWHRGECPDINAEAIQALEERNRRRAPGEPCFRDRAREEVTVNVGGIEPHSACDDRDCERCRRDLEVRR